MTRKQSVFVGDKFELSNGGFAIVKEYKNSTCVIVKTNNGYTCKTSSYKLNIGQLQDPLAKTIFNVACIGIGKHVAKFNSGKKNIHYTIWYNMISRCYSLKRLTYLDCYVSNEWLNFQNFAEWSEKNYKEGLELDKDFKVYNNKLYSKDNCLYIQRNMNCLFRIPNKKSKLPFGVTIMNNNYCSGQSIKGERIQTSDLTKAINHHWNLYYKIVLQVVEKNEEYRELILNRFEDFFSNNYPEY